MGTSHSGGDDGRGSFDRVSLADLDGDGRPDVLAVNGGEGRGSIADTTGPGISWFTLPPDPLEGEAWSEHVVLKNEQAVNARPIDLDADGDLDIVAGTGESRPLVWFENTPAESTGDAEESIAGVSFSARDFWGDEGPTGARPDGSRMDFGDLNADGRVDLVTLSADDPSELLWIEQPSDLSASWSLHSLGTISPDRVTHFRIVDINGDKKLDVIVGSRGVEISDEAVEDDKAATAANPSGRIAWFENPGKAAGSWARHDISRRAQGSYVGFVPYDVDEDGDVDFFVTRGGSGKFDGLIWLQQLHSGAPAIQFTPAREEGDKPLGLPAG